MGSDSPDLPPRSSSGHRVPAGRWARLKQAWCRWWIADSETSRLLSRWDQEEDLREAQRKSYEEATTMSVTIEIPEATERITLVLASESELDVLEFAHAHDVEPAFLPNEADAKFIYVDAVVDGRVLTTVAKVTA